MAQLYLPAEHTEADLVLAGQIAQSIDSAELYVAWTPAHGQAVPAVAAELRTLDARWTGTLALVFRAVRELWTVLRGRDSQRAPLAPAPAGGHAAQPKPAAGEAPA
jgi:hypothetical protein